MINRYYDSTCLIIITEMNLRLKALGISREDQIDFAKRYSEKDFVFRLGFPFRHYALFPIDGTKGHDIIVTYGGTTLIAEVKQWRPIKRRNWVEAFEKDFRDLVFEINQGNKGKHAIICGWFTIFEWVDLLQLGSTIRGNPKVNRKRLEMLPFIKARWGGRVRNLYTDYSKACDAFTYDGAVVNWELYGDKDDIFNIAMFW